MKYKHVGTHAEDLADGRMIGPGETVDLDKDQTHDPHNERLLVEGILMPLDKKAEHETELAERRESRREPKEEE